MSTLEIASPTAAEIYFNHSLIGRLATLVAEALAGARPGAPATPGRAGGSRAGAASKRPKTRAATLLDRLDAWFWHQEQQRREAYLAQSRDIFDLERRIALLERGSVAHW